MAAPAAVPLFILCSLVQFIHDSVGTGWGIPWLFPFSSLRFKFVYQYDLRKAGLPQKIAWAWSPDEQRRLAQAYGDPHWHQHTFRFWQYASLWKLSEILVLAIAGVALYAQLR